MKPRDAPQPVSPEEIADDIVKTRARLSRGLATLDREYALRNLLVHGVRHASKGDLAMATVGAAARKNIVPLAVIGIGLAWLSLARRGEGADLARRVAEALAHLQRLAQNFIAPSR